MSKHISIPKYLHYIHCYTNIFVNFYITYDWSSFHLNEFIEVYLKTTTFTVNYA